MISGGGSAQVDPIGGNAIKPPGQGATHWLEEIWFPTSPLKAIQARAPKATVKYDPGIDPAAAAAAAKGADVAIVFGIPVGERRHGPALAGAPALQAARAERRSRGRSERGDRSGGGGQSAHHRRARVRHPRHHAVGRRAGGNSRSVVSPAATAPTRSATFSSAP